MKTKRYLFVLNHPSQLHVFKNVARKLMNDGHKCIFFIQQRDIVEDLVVKEGFEYRYAVSPYWRKKLKGKYGVSLRGIIHVIQASFRFFNYSLFNRVDMYFGSDASITHVGRLFRKPTFVITDDDYYYIKQLSTLSFPFTTHILAADVVDVGKWEYKKIAYTGNQKLGYLHPNVFKPDISVLEKYGLQKHKYTIIRAVSFEAQHDVTHEIKTGLTSDNVRKMLHVLEKYGEVLISTEYNVAFFEDYQKAIDPEDMHSLIYYARLFISDSQSMHIEAGLLGTPSIRSNAWVDKPMPLNCIKDIEENLGLGISVSPKDSALLLEKVTEMVHDGVKEIWLDRRKKAFEKYVDYTSFLYWFIKEYPESLKVYRKDPKGTVARFVSLGE